MKIKGRLGISENKYEGVNCLFAGEGTEKLKDFFFFLGDKDREVIEDLYLRNQRLDISLEKYFVF